MSLLKYSGTLVFSIWNAQMQQTSEMPKWFPATFNREGINLISSENCYSEGRRAGSGQIERIHVVGSITVELESL